MCIRDSRQIVATRKTVGQYKVDVAEQRIHEIDPNIKTGWLSRYARMVTSVNLGAELK